MHACQREAAHDPPAITRFVGELLRRRTADPCPLARCGGSLTRTTWPTSMAEWIRITCSFAALHEATSQWLRSNLPGEQQLPFAPIPKHRMKTHSFFYCSVHAIVQADPGSLANDFLSGSTKPCCRGLHMFRMNARVSEPCIALRMSGVTPIDVSAWGIWWFLFVHRTPPASKPAAMTLQIRGRSRSWLSNPDMNARDEPAFVVQPDGLRSTASRLQQR